MVLLTTIYIIIKTIETLTDFKKDLKYICFIHISFNILFSLSCIKISKT